MNLPRLIAIPIQVEQDIVAARQRARQIAEAVGFDRQDQVRIATAVSEIARNAFEYAGGGKAEFSIGLGSPANALEIFISDSGPGIQDLNGVLNNTYRSATGMGLGILGARRLMDVCSIQSGDGGTRVHMIKYLPAASQLRNASDLSAVAATLAAIKPAGTVDEVLRQNQEVLQALDDLHQREADLGRLNQELEDTNRGVMALYAELDDKAASLRRANEIKSRFLSHMSHEFRTPLNSILALVALLESRLDGDLTQEQAKQIGYIHRAADELLQMVNDLLDLAKVEAGKFNVVTSHFAVVNLFGALRGMLRPLLGSDAVALVMEDPDPSVTLATDEGKVNQVLRNLISNALKFTEHGEVRVKMEINPDGLVFSVADTGIGIPASEQEQIFQEFAQVQNPLQRRLKGTGLGLPLSRKLAELLGGTLTVQSEPGVGSTFFFRLPRAVLGAATSAGEPAESTRFAPAEPRQVDSGTVLVIDDDEVSWYVVEQLLRDTDFVVTHAENGPLGIERARFDRPGVILLDLNMPGLSGFEVLEQLKADPETAPIPVVVCTSRSLSVPELARLQRDAAAVLSKHELPNNRLLDLVHSLAKAK